MLNPVFFMKSKSIPQLRLQSQQVSSSKFNSPTQLVQYMGAMQAQDFAMVKWAVGLRLVKSCESDIDAALDNGTILRTHLLRPTWHLVAAEDIHWILNLSAPQIQNLAKLRYKELELTREVFSKSYKVIESALKTNESCSRERLKNKLESAGIDTNNQRLSYLLLNAEIQGIICSGKIDGRKTTYALLDQRVPEKKVLPREEALAALALRYFNSHGPATLKDFVWWSGLSVSDSRAGIEEVKSELISESIEGNVYFLHPSLSQVPDKKSSLYLLPAFDEYFISYTDRSAVLAKEHHARAASSNGIFWPIIVYNGKIRGTWKRTIKRDKVVVESSFFSPPSGNLLQKAKTQARHYGKFLEKESIFK